MRLSCPKSDASFPISPRSAVPRAIGDRAVPTWQRPESEDPLPIETPDQRSVRHRAASVSLISRAIEETGIAEDEDVFKVDAWFVGDALRAADDAGLLNE